MFTLNVPAEREAQTARPWWLEREIVWLVLLVLAAYFVRAGDLPIQGEEPTRAQIAKEMVESGDWIVPRQQGVPFLTRPPFQNWLIALTHVVTGDWDVWTIRLHALLATLLTTLLIYGYARVFLSRLGALASAASFATLAHMFTKGYQAETDALFIFLISGSLLLWHWGMMRRWPDAVTFSAGYGLMALGMLTKGLQAPTYFVGAIVVYLALTRQWGRLFSKGHLVGALVAAVILLAWIVPFGSVVGWYGVYSAWMADAAMTSNSEVQTWKTLTFAQHLLLYPLQVLAATLPWSVLLLLYLRRDFRAAIRDAKPHVLFLTVALAVAFPTCWVPPLGLTRYFAPLYPCLAILIGLAIQRCAEADAGSRLQSLWRQYLLLSCTAMWGATLVFVGLSLLGIYSTAAAAWAEPPLVALAYGVAAVALIGFVYRLRVSTHPSRVRLAVLGLASFLVLAFSGVMTDLRLQRSESPSAAMERLKEKLPPHQQLVSLGKDFDCLFAYHYGMPIIRPRPRPFAVADVDPQMSYFCFMSIKGRRPILPFDWEEIETVPMDRYRLTTPERVVVVGRRLPVSSAGDLAARR